MAPGPAPWRFLRVYALLAALFELPSCLAGAPSPQAGDRAHAFALAGLMATRANYAASAGVSARGGRPSFAACASAAALHVYELAWFLTEVRHGLAGGTPLAVRVLIVAQAAAFLAAAVLPASAERGRRGAA